MVGFIVGFVIVLLTAAAAFGTYVCKCKKKTGASVVLGILSAVLLIAFILIPFSFHTVDAGEVAVVKHFGEAKAVRSAGLHFDLWATNTYVVYDARVQKVDIETMTYSSDAQTMDVSMTLQYSINPDEVIEITKQYGSLDLLQAKLESIVIEKTKAVLSSYKAMDIIANRAEMSPKVEEAIRAAVGEEYHVAINTVVLTNIDFSDAFESAVEDKMIAEQKLLQAEYENQTTIAQAQAKADALVIAAQGEKDANELLQKSLTAEILKSQWIDKWNGELPDTMAGDDTTLAIVP